MKRQYLLPFMEIKSHKIAKKGKKIIKVNETKYIVEYNKKRYICVFNKKGMLLTCYLLWS